MKIIQIWQNEGQRFDPLRAANCYRISRLVVDEDYLMWLKILENRHVLVNQFHGNLKPLVVG